MDLFILIGVVFLTSSLVAVGNIILLKVYFAGWIEKKFENIKADIRKDIQSTMEKAIDQFKDIKKIRIEAYSMLSSNIYNIRNLFRDSIASLESLKSEQIVDLQNAQEELINLLVKNKGYLEAQLFNKLHNFKNKAIMPVTLLEEVIYCIKHKKNNEMQTAKDKLIKLYDEIDKDYIEISENLQKDINTDLEK